MKNWLYTTLLMLALSLSAQAQLQKGDWMLDFGAGLSINHKTSTFSHTNYNSSFTPQAGYMLTDRWMGGALVGFSSGNLYSPLGRYNRSYYSIDPFVRHYFPTKGAWQAFAEARFNFTQISNQSVQGDTVPQFTEDGNYYSAEAGVGFDYFIAPNIAVEAGLKYRFLHGGSYDGSSYDRDLIQFDLDGKIVDFEVMVRPLSGLQALGEEMGKRLAPYLAAFKGATPAA